MTNNLGGIPSIVFGLFGMALFVNRLNFGDSIIAGSFTLGLLGASADYPGDGRSPSGYPRLVQTGKSGAGSHQTSNNPEKCSSS